MTLDVAGVAIVGVAAAVVPWAAAYTVVVNSPQLRPVRRSML